MTIENSRGDENAMKMDYLLVADTSVLTDDFLFDAAYARATDERKGKVDRYRFRRDQCAALGAELLLRHALDRLGIRKLSYGYGEAGKPYLAGEDGVFFSLSHSGKFALCAVSAYEIGADIETIRKADIRIAERFFCPSEYDRIAAQETEAARQALFFRYWTMKESFLKATGYGLRVPMNECEILLREENIAVVQNVDPRQFYFREYDDISGCRCAVCTADAPFRAELKTINLKDCL